MLVANHVNGEMCCTLGTSSNWDHIDTPSAPWELPDLENDLVRPCLADLFPMNRDRLAPAASEDTNEEL